MNALSRRHLIGIAAAAFPASLLAPRLAAAQTSATEIGTSQGGRPLIVYHLGDGWCRLFLLGGQHGGPEVNTMRLTQALMDHFTANAHELPFGVGIDFMLAGNPDGLATGSRQFLSGVDPNRNWGGAGWASDASDSNGAFRSGLGGPEPFSEPETRALADWLTTWPPAFLVNYHSVGGFLFGGGEGVALELVEAYASASGYPRVGGGTGRSSPLTYRASGTMNGWLRELGVPGILIELSTTTGTDFDRNLAGIRAVLPILGSLASQPYSDAQQCRLPEANLPWLSC